MKNPAIRIRLEAYDHELLDQAVRDLIEAVGRTTATIRGPIPLPTRIERITVLRSPHVDKKSREQFEIRTHKRLLDISDFGAKTIDALKNMAMPAGVQVKIKA